MTLQQELEYYKKALEDYTESLGASDLRKEELNTEWGFCLYFDIIHNRDLEEFPVLISLSPGKCYSGISWFKPGAIEPRIELLLRAIDIVEAKIKEESTKSTIE